MIRDKLINKIIIVALTVVLVIAMTGTPYAINNVFASEVQNIVSVENETNNTFEPTAIPIAGMLVADVLLKWLTAAVVATLVVSGVALIEDIYDTVNSNRNKTEYKYYIVTYDKSNYWKLQTKKALTFEEALVYIQTGKESNVWTPNSNDAYVLATAVTGRPAVGPENEWQNGHSERLYYNHYHSSDRSSGHVFYGKDGRFGAGARPYNVIESEEVIDLAS